MAAGDVTEDEPDQPLAAGTFSGWLTQMQRALGGGAGSDVPCDDCTACCTSSQFVHIGPHEVETLAHIPDELLFPAPRLPRGHMVLGYDDKGHCPMLVGGQCSIYQHRPTTCRTYDCRIFPAAGIEIDDQDQVAIARRARRWQFAFPEDIDRIQHQAVRAAARFVREHRDLRDLLPDRAGPARATEIAVLAVRVHEAFVHHDDETACQVVVDPEPEANRAALPAPTEPR